MPEQRNVVIMKFKVVLAPFSVLSRNKDFLVHFERLGAKIIERMAPLVKIAFSAGFDDIYDGFPNPEHGQFVVVNWESLLEFCTSLVPFLHACQFRRIGWAVNVEKLLEYSVRVCALIQ